MKMTAKDVKEITYMPLVTFFSVLARPGKNRKGVATTLVRQGLKTKQNKTKQTRARHFLFPQIIFILFETNFRF